MFILTRDNTVKYSTVSYHIMEYCTKCYFYSWYTPLVEVNQAIICLVVRQASQDRKYVHNPRCKTFPTFSQIRIKKNVRVFLLDHTGSRFRRNLYKCSVTFHQALINSFRITLIDWYTPLVEVIQAKLLGQLDKPSLELVWTRSERTRHKCHPLSCPKYLWQKHPRLDTG